MMILLLLLIPLLLAAMPLVIRNPRWLGWITSVGYLAQIATVSFLVLRYLSRGVPLTFNHYLYVDALSLFFAFTISIVTLAAALYSVNYIAGEVEHQVISERKGRLYYALFNLFIFSMFLAVVVNNLGILWVAIEMTTLATAFLVGFYNTRNSVEAAWKYIIICSVGILLALAGTILFSYALLFSTGMKSLNWTDLRLAAKQLDPRVLKLAFIFIFIGYGTKAGLAPMHTWLPDAHSQAITPISALLSGVLLKTAIYAILRFTMVINACAGVQFSSHLLLIFGLLSLATAAGLALVQKDLKRLLAYSSIEHMGIMAIGFGIGGPLGILGGLWHVFNHAMTKSLMFLGAGTIVNTYKTHNLHSIRGAIKVLPFTGVMFLLGALALIGLPPFSIFFSEIIILIAAFTQGAYLAAGGLLLGMAVIFGAIVHLLSRSLFGNRLQQMEVVKEPVLSKLALILLFIFICSAGFFVPGPLQELIAKTVSILRGV